MNYYIDILRCKKKKKHFILFEIGFGLFSFILQYKTIKLRWKYNYLRLNNLIHNDFMNILMNYIHIYYAISKSGSRKKKKKNREMHFHELIYIKKPEVDIEPESSGFYSPSRRPVIAIFTGGKLCLTNNHRK